MAREREIKEQLIKAKKSTEMGKAVVTHRYLWRVEWRNWESGRE